MEFLFVSIYDFFKKHPRVLWTVFIVFIGLSAFFASTIKIKENVSDIFPDDEKTNDFNQVFQSRALEKLVFMVSLKDSAKSDPDNLILFADSLVSKIQKQSEEYISELNFRVDDERALNFFNSISDHLPVFLADEDYVKLDSILQPKALKLRINENYRQLISPSGIFAKRLYSKDILGISQLGLSKLQQLQYDDNYVLYDNCLFTKDLKHLLFFIVPKFSASNTGKNIVFVDLLDGVVQSQNESSSIARANYFGGTVVAVGNARQIRKDTQVTVSLTIFFLIVFIVWFFRKKRAPLIILIPVLFGGLFSLACLAVIKGSVSVLALAAGSIILGIAINYSLHFIVHIQHAQDARKTIRDLATPMTLGSATTVLAFLGLQFANAGILRDIGLFAACSLIGAALCSLIFLPHFFKPDFFLANEKAEHHLQRILSVEPRKKKWAIVGILVATPFFFYFASDVEFNSDMNKLNFMSNELKQSHDEFSSINEFALQSVYLVVKGDNEQQALKRNETILKTLEQKKREGTINKFLSPSLLLVSDSLQQERIKKWNAFWNENRRKDVLNTLKQEGQALKFSPAVYTNFNAFIERNYEPLDVETKEELKRNFFNESIISANNQVTLITPVSVKPELKNKFYASVENLPGVKTLDRQSLTNNFIGKVNADFTFIVMFTSVLVFGALLLAYGRIELALITFVPMFVTWIWILGIMALLKIEFNIVNVMVSTFIFGLGDDYSIFTMDGLQQQYKTGRKNISSVRISIFISAVTTTIGLGVLFFAKHPALQSIALISITGIVCVFIMSQTLEPFLFNLIITSRTKKGLAPITFWGMCKTVFAFSLFVFGSWLLSVMGFILLKLNPFKHSAFRLMFHSMVSAWARAIIYVMANVKKKLINAEGALGKPCIIICNHNSFLDILLTVMLSPKLILVTNKWVWNSPVFGGVVRLAEYFPVTEGAEESIDRIRKKIDDGFSVVIFPEGTRSADGKINRFHKGAFYLAEKLQLDIRPLLIHGTHETITKSDFYLNDSNITLKFLPRITPDDHSFGDAYSVRTKSISKYFKNEFALLKEEMETPASFRYKLMRNYYYKGPVLEWYMRVKLRLENNYEKFDKMIPRKANILDLGCGYGAMSYMLHFLSEGRTITGVDYDQDKIDTANHCYSKSDRISFFCHDITEFPVSKYDVIIISDVLHYLSPDQQTAVLRKCFQGINPGGKIIIRDGNAELADRHQNTRSTEFFSTKVFRFNKTSQKLNFMKGETIKQEAQKYNLNVEVLEDSKYTSNVIFVIK